MPDIFDTPTLETVGERGRATPQAKAPGPGFFGSIAPGFRRAHAGEDWGWNQYRYEQNLKISIAVALRKRGYDLDIPNFVGELWAKTLRYDRTFPEADRSFHDYGGIKRSDKVWRVLAAERKRDPGFLEGYGSVVDEKSLRAWALDHRKADMAKADKELRGGSFAGQMVGALGAGALDPTSYIPVGGGAAKGVSIARQIMTVGAREAAANVAVAALQEPMVSADAKALGVERTQSDFVNELLLAGGTGGALGTAGKTLHIAGGAAIDRMTPVDRKLARALENQEIPLSGAQELHQRNIGRYHAYVRGASEHALVDAFDETVPPGMRTPDEDAAAAVVRRSADHADTSPYVPGVDGDDAHAAATDLSLDAIVNGGGAVPDAPARVPIRSGGGSMTMHAALERQESRGRQFGDDGAPLTSHAGAVGVMQVMPGTGPEAARLAGLPWDLARLRSDANYNRALGQAYFDRQLHDFGDPAKAAAAYNAGPGNLRHALRAAEAAGEAGNWEAYLPAETQDYVRKFRERTGTAPILAGSAAAEAPLPARIVPEIADDAFDSGKQGVLAGYLSGEAGLPVMHMDTFRPEDITVDAETMQFKAGGDSYGVTDRLQGVTRWEPGFAGRVMVWEGADGRRLVADGHQRVGLAKRIMADDPGQDIRLDTLVLREADGISAGDARTIAAMKNMAEGSGTALDAAKLVRDAGPAVLDHVPPRSALTRDAHGLARLRGEAFGMAVNELVPADQAAIVGRLVPDDEARQSALLKLLVATEPATARQAESIARQGIAAGFATDGFEADLFGGREGMSSLFLNRAKVLERGLRALRKLKLVHSTAAREADILEQAGSTIARSRSEQEAQANAEAIDLIDRLAHRAGPVKQALDDAVAGIPAGRSVNDAVASFVKLVRDIDLAAAARDAERGAGQAVEAGGSGDARGRGGGAAEADAGASSRDTDAAVAAAPIAAEGEPARFADPVGDGARAQSDSIEHDLRMGETAGDRQTATLQSIVEGQRGASLADLIARARENQSELAAIGKTLARESGVEFVDPGAKDAARAAEKLASEGYADAGEMKDLSRGAFVVDSPAAAERIVAALADRFAVHDKGWQRLDTGYIDRKLIARFDNGGVGEMQIVPRAVWEAKKSELGALYERSRSPETPGEEAEQLEARQRDGYAAALAGSDFSELSSADRSASGNARANASAESRTPSDDALLTSPGAERQSPPDHAQAAERSARRATGRSSTSNSSNAMGEPSGTHIGAEMSTGNEQMFRVDEEGDETTIGDLLTDIESDAQAVETMRSCMAPPSGEA